MAAVAGTQTLEELLEDLEKNTVKFISNFDNTETEPEVVAPAAKPRSLGRTPGDMPGGKLVYVLLGVSMVLAVIPLYWAFVVATSKKADDDPVVEIARDVGFDVFRMAARQQAFRRQVRRATQLHDPLGNAIVRSSSSWSHDQQVET